ncbi:MAG: CvpA family protein [Cytophagales bacterium]|nr:CvpA family protein [Cytophagales bacterium]
MNLLDIVLAVILLFAAYKGFQRGFLLEVIAVAAFVLAVLGGFKLLHWGMELLGQYFNLHGEILPYVSFVLIFIAIVLIVNVIGRFLKKIVDMTLLGPVDSIAGAVISMIKWAFGISIILWLSNSFGLVFPGSWVDQSILYPYLLTFAPQVVDVFSSVLPFTDDLFKMIRDLLQGDSAA